MPGSNQIERTAHAVRARRSSLTTGPWRVKRSVTVSGAAPRTAIVSRSVRIASQPPL